MKQWALAHGTIIDGAMHFPKQLLSNIATLRFNPEGALTSGTWIGRGLTIMCCIPYEPGMWDEIRAKEDATKATATTRTYSEELRLVFILAGALFYGTVSFRKLTSL
jgi:hypothetical protein